MTSRLPITAMLSRTDYWVVPWALTLDDQGHLHLSSCVEVADSPVGTAVQLRLRREADGLHVHLDSRMREASDYRWAPEADDGSPWFELPVVAVWVDEVRLTRAALPPTLLRRDRPVAA